MAVVDADDLCLGLLAGAARRSERLGHPVEQRKGDVEVLGQHDVGQLVERAVDVGLAAVRVQFGQVDPAPQVEDEALTDLRWRLRLPCDSTHDAALRAAMGDLLDRNAEGQLIPQNQPRHVVVLWWTTSSEF